MRAAAAAEGKVRKNVSRQLGFRFKNVFSTSGLFFVEKRPVFRFEGPGAPLRVLNIRSWKGKRGEVAVLAVDSASWT